MVSLIYLALFGMMLLIIMSIVSNSGETSIVNIENQLFLFNCPAPLFNGIVNATDPGTTIEGFAVVWDSSEVIYGGDNNQTGTFFDCYIAPLTPHPAFGVNLSQKNYGETAFSVIPIGWFSYLGDTLSNGFAKLQAMLTLITFILTPVNFSIMGFTIADLSGLALMAVIALYAIAYIFIGIFIYKTISPFVGLG